jgi:hypothetical protein
MMSELKTKKNGQSSFAAFDSSLEFSEDDYKVSANIKSLASLIGPAVPNGSSS